MYEKLLQPIWTNFIAIDIKADRLVKKKHLRKITGFTLITSLSVRTNNLIYRVNIYKS